VRDLSTAGHPQRPAAVYGGGGLFGIGFTLGITEALVDGGHRVGKRSAIGTSAGSWSAASLALGIRFADAIDLLGDRVPRLPDPRAGRLHALAAELFGETTRVASVRVVAASLPRLQRVVLQGAEWPIADLVSASSAVPAMLAPHRVGATRYVDGGVRSMASVDLADPTDDLLVVLPMATAMFGPAGRLIERRTRRELSQWTSAHRDARVTVVRPGPEVMALARRPDQLFEPARARRCYELAYEHGTRLREQFAVA
jgi:NTE family protein